jgi:hypothetical protein
MARMTTTLPKSLSYSALFHVIVSPGNGPQKFLIEKANFATFIDCGIGHYPMS